jgi:hypothetical protein
MVFSGARLGASVGIRQRDAGGGARFWLRNSGLGGKFVLPIIQFDGGCSVKARISFFLLLGIACSLVHFHLRLLLLLWLSPTTPHLSILWEIVRTLASPAIFLETSSWGMSHSMILFIANSLLWGFCLGALIFWLRWRHVRSPTIRFC